MRYSSLIVAACAACVLSAAKLPAQNAKIPVMQAAALFVKDSLPPGPVLLDLEGVPSNSVEADKAAKALGATSGTAASAISCVAVQVPRPSRKCTVANKAVIVEVESPFVLGRKARTTVSYSHETSPDRVHLITYDLELVSDANGVWRVAKVVAIAAT